MTLGPDLIQEMRIAAIKAGLHTKRMIMMGGIDVEYVAGLYTADIPSDQLLLDLTAMNNVGLIANGVAPLERWLRNAAVEMRMQPEQHKYFADLADQVALKVLPPPLSTLYQQIKDAFPVPKLKEILTYDLKVDGTDFSLLRTSAKDESVLRMLQEAFKKGIAKRLLEALRDAQPQSSSFVADANKALEMLREDYRLGVDRPRDDVALPPCPGCWWREAATGGYVALAASLDKHIKDVRTNTGIPDLTDALPIRLAHETPDLDFGTKIVTNANAILKIIKNFSVDGRLIAADFESRRIEDAWAGVLVDADSKGPATLVALFLAIYLKRGNLSSLADTNLRRLINVVEAPNA